MISEIDAHTLTQDIVSGLATWSALVPALQSGGLEQKANAVVAGVLDRLASRSDMLCIREYRNADFVLFSRDDDTSARLNIKAVIELKFNYAKQDGEIVARLPEAVAQARRYQEATRAGHAYVIYFLAAPSCDHIPGHPRDSGWAYWDSSTDDAAATLGKAKDHLLQGASSSGSRILGMCSSSDPIPLHCVMLDAGQ